MSVVSYDRVLETVAASAGTSTFTLTGAVTGYQAFSARVATGRPTTYFAQEVDASGNPSGAWEHGIGVYTLSGTTLSRLAIIESSNSDALVNFSAALRVGIGAGSDDINPKNLLFYGDGSDGDVTVSGSVTLSRDMYYRNLTLSAGAALNPAGYRIYVSETLDLSAAPANAIAFSGGGGVAGGSGGTGGAAVTGVNVGGSGGGGAGGPSATKGTDGTAVSPANGGKGGAGGKDGAGTHAGGISGAVSLALPVRTFARDLMRALAVLLGGGGGGGGGGGSSTGGGGAAGGGVVWISARVINRGGSTAAGCVATKGGNGGAGTGGVTTGAGGGAGGGGGWIFLCYGALQGSTATNALDASGGAGGVGGTGTSTGGDGGNGGDGGRITVLNLGGGTITETAGSAGGSGGAHSGTTGGTAGTAGACTASL